MKTYIVMYEKETLDQIKALFESDIPGKGDKLYLVGAKETSITMADARTLFELPIKPLFINPSEDILNYTIGYLIGSNKADNITVVVNKENNNMQSFIKEVGADVKVITAKTVKRVKKENSVIAEVKPAPQISKPSAKEKESVTITPSRTRKKTATALSAKSFDEMIKNLEKQSKKKLGEYSDKIKTVVSDASDPEIGLPMLLRLHAIPDDIHDIIKDNFRQLKELAGK